MSFITFNSHAVTGTKGLPVGYISLGKTQIYLGKEKLPFEFVKIEYDKEILAIRFSEASEAIGMKVKTNKFGTPFINSYAFMQAKILSPGRYKKIAEYTYQLVK